MDASLVSIIVPAAGRSSRFGERNKLDMPWEETTVMGKVLELAASLLPMEVVVVRRSGSAVPGVRTVFNRDPQLGLASSIGVGIRSASPDAQGFLVWPADMPLIPTSVVEELLQEASTSNCTRPRYDGRPGHPVFFGRDNRARLCELKEGDGARGVLQQVGYLETSHPGVVQDIDTVEQYRLLRGPHA